MSPGRCGPASRRTSRIRRRDKPAQAAGAGLAPQTRTLTVEQALHEVKGRPEAEGAAGLNAKRARHEAAKLLQGVTPHALRHTHAAMLIAEGAPANEIQARLGHANIRITLELYGHLFPEEDREAGRRVERFLADVGIGPK